MTLSPSSAHLTQRVDMRTIVLERDGLLPTLADLWWAGPKPRAVAWVFDGQVLRDSAVRAAWPAGVAAVGVHGTANRDAEYAHARDPRPSCALRSEPRGWAHARAMNLAAQTTDLSSIGVDAHTPRLAVGASLGGLAAMLCAVASPSHWRGVVGLSPSVGWARETDPISKRWIRQVGDRCALYLDAGGATEADDNRWAVNAMAQELRRVGLRRWTAPTFPGAAHAWSAWAGRVGPALEWALDLRGAIE